MKLQATKILNGLYMYSKFKNEMSVVQKIIHASLYISNNFHFIQCKTKRLWMQEKRITHTTLK